MWADLAAEQYVLDYLFVLELFIMKKVICLIAVLALTAPALAGTITLSAVDNGNGSCNINFSTTGSSIAGIALDVTAVNAITGCAVGNSFFDVLIDLAYDEETGGNGYTYGEGSNPVADPVAAGQLSLPQTSFCISMAGLGGTVNPLATAPTSGTLAVMSDDGTGSSGTITANVIRGGAVDNAGNAMTIAGLPLAFSIADTGGPPCFTMGWTDSDGDVITDAAMVTRYNGLTQAEKDCWCSPCFGSGDGNMDCAISSGDFDMVVNLLTGVFLSPYAGNACGDYNYDGALTSGDFSEVVDLLTGVFNTCTWTCP